MAILSAPTLDRLLLETRAMLNQPDMTNSSWTDQELSFWLNDAVNRYFVDVVENAEGQFTAQVDLDIVQNAETVALPSDFYKVKNLYKKIDNGFRIIPYQNWLNQSYDTDASLGRASNAFTYFFRSNNIILRPIPNFSETAGLRLEYIQFPDNMIWGGDSLTAEVSPLFKELIIMYAVAKAKIRESLVTGSDTSSQAQGLLQGLETQFRESVRGRSKYPQFTIPFNP